MRKTSPQKALKQRARLPHGLRIYAIGDIHGRVDLLEQVFAKIDVDLAARPAERTIHVFLGDYVDRGPSSRQVLDLLIERGRMHETVGLRGNHEALVMQFLSDPQILDQWRRFGGFETLISYGVIPSNRNSPEERQRLAAALNDALPSEHRRFLDTLVPYFAFGDFFFVHAGVRPGVPLENQDEQDLLWIRDDFLLCLEDYGKFIVHGHSPVLQPEIRPNRLNIDTGAYATGRLTCVMLEADELLFI